MSIFDGSQQDDVDGRLRWLLIELGHLLAPVTVGLAHEMIDASESPIALDMMSEMLVEAGVSLDRRIVDEVADLAAAMGLGPEPAGRLEPLVRERSHEEDE
jgi:hypothetical protein